jgi:UDP-N-acetyl-D-mannosaminuronate dehydrogenase
LGDLNGKTILIVGVSYKSNIADTRESPVKPLLSKLRARNAKVFWHDDLVKEWNNEKSVPISSDYDLAIIATLHDYVDLTKLGNVPIVNTRRST